MEGTILKVNMINPGVSCATSYTVEEIASANLEVNQISLTTISLYYTILYIQVQLIFIIY